MVLGKELGAQTGTRMDPLIGLVWHRTWDIQGSGPPGGLANQLWPPLREATLGTYMIRVDNV